MMTIHTYEHNLHKDDNNNNESANDNYDYCYKKTLTRQCLP